MMSSTTEEAKERMVQACIEGSIETVEELLKNGFDAIGTAIQWKDQDDGNLVTKPAIFCAVDHGQTQVVKVFIDSGIDVNCIDDDGFTPIQLASYMGHIDVIHLLITNGANVDQECLDWANEKEHNNPNRVEVIKLLLQYVDLYSNYGDDILAMMTTACQYGDINKVKELLKNGYKWDINETTEHNPILIANRNGYVEIVQLLQEYGVQVPIMEE